MAHRGGEVGEGGALPYAAAASHNPLRVERTKERTPPRLLVFALSLSLSLSRAALYLASAAAAARDVVTRECLK